MGEIKSTLDLVMERTGHLSMSAEEKNRQRQTDFEKRLQGFLNKYADGLLGIHNFKDQIEELKAAHKIADRKLVIKTVLERIDPGNGNKHWLDLIAALEPSIIDSVENIISAYQHQQKHLLQTSGHKMLNKLDHQYRIKGSAVIPNPLKDVRYQENITTLEHGARAKIEALSG